MKNDTERFTEKELRGKEKRFNKKVKEKSFAGEVKDALAKKKLNKRQSY